ncbi:LmeA family phospholipid-binding protein [Cellulomonas soli]
MSRCAPGLRWPSGSGSPCSPAVWWSATGSPRRWPRTSLADRLTSRVEVTGTPHVRVGGFPFLTQLASGTFSHVTVALDGAVLDGVQVTAVTVDARDVTRGDPVTVGTLDAALTLPVATVQEAASQRTGLDVTVSVQGDALQGSMSLLGVPLAVTFVPRVEDGRLLVDAGALSLGGSRSTPPRCRVASASASPAWRSPSTGCRTASR